jgi:phenylalanyl-tRNA synthetase alpha chain
MTTYLTPDQLHEALTLRDLSNPEHGLHSMQELLGHVTTSLTHSMGIMAQTVRNSPLVSVTDNYDKLGFASSTVTRDQRYSRYVSPTVMLRSHTSASVPYLLRNLPHTDSIDELVVMPGLVYRRDAIDRTHVGAPHQVDLWRISSFPTLTPSDLESMVASLVEAVLPNAQWRTVPAVHPYTTNGMQVDVLIDDEWLELAECGMMAPHLFAEAGLDPEQWSGLALGMGLDRALMLRKGIPDIRLLRAVDERISSQMLNLEPWQHVSLLPSTRRDISIVVPGSFDDEILGDEVRQALGARMDDLESVELLDLTPFEDLPEVAQARLQIEPGQANALIRIVLRPIERTLTAPEANLIRDDIYKALHQGPVMELIAS